jgi:hypothetical protein
MTRYVRTFWRVLDEHERFSTIETTLAESARPTAG